MVVISRGSFLMGAPDDEAWIFGDETPQHRVSIDVPIALARHEVTRAQFAQFVRETGHRADGCHVPKSSGRYFNPAKSWRDPGFPQGDRHPVTCVNWEDAVAYSDWLPEKTGATYRLPSSAEWEYAARAGTTTRFYWGDEVGDGNVNCGYCPDEFEFTAPVGTFRPNGFGLHNMAGNVWEWVADCWNWTYDGAPDDGSAWETGDCTVRVIRGGSWFHELRFIRSAFRNFHGSDKRVDWNGFRVARALDEQGP